MPRRTHLGAALLALTLASTEILAQFKPASQPYGQGEAYPAGQPAQNAYDGAAGPGDDPEAIADGQHGVARLSLMLGEVGIRRGDTSEVVAAVVNAPLQKGDSVQTSPTGAAEVQFDGGNVIRLAENSEVGFAELQFRRVQIQLTAGSALYRVLRPSNLDVEIDTPTVAVRPLGVSAIRITLLEGGVARIAVYTGSAEMIGPGGTQPLQAGATVLARMGSTGPEFQETGTLPQDQFDAWNLSRDEQLLRSPSVPLVGSEVSGTEDLDRNGSWVPSQYGQVWEPRDVGQDWAPYSNGEWSWQTYYGWTWVDYSPWGWAPYHYGRWFRNGSYGWCWWPGAKGGVHVWRPALVGFFGSGVGLGWVALAPHEGFQAWWGRRNLIGGNRYGVGSGVRFQNAAFRGAALFASRDNFSGPHRRFGWASPEQIRGGTRFDGSLPITPNHSSYRFSDRAFVGRGGIPSAVGSGRPPGYSVSPRPSYSRRNAAPVANGWQRFGDPGAQRNYTGATYTATPRGESGWHDFGRPPSQQSQQPSRSFGSRSYRTYEAPQIQTPRSPVTQGSGSGWRSFSSRPAPQTWSGPARSSGSGEPHYNAPQRSYQQPATPHYSQPSREAYRGFSGGSFNRPSPRSSPNGNGGAGNHGGGGRPSGGGGHSRR